MQWLDSSLDDSLERLRAPGSRNFIFGAGQVGQMTLRVCRDAGVAIHVLCDNSPAKIGSEIANVPVVSPEAALPGCSDGNIIVAVLNQSALDEALRQSALFATASTA